MKIPKLLDCPQTLVLVTITDFLTLEVSLPLPVLALGGGLKGNIPNGTEIEKTDRGITLPYSYPKMKKKFCLKVV